MKAFLQHYIIRWRYPLQRLIAPLLYRWWMRRLERRISGESPTSLAGAAETLPVFNLISIVPSAATSSLAYMGQALQKQTYPRWVWWVLVNPTKGSTSRVKLSGLFETEPRIRVLSAQSGVGAALRTLLEEISGDLLLFLGLQGELAPHALHEVAILLERSPTSDVIYFDQDQINPLTARRRAPWFKPAWSPELLLSVDYLQPCVIRRSLLEGLDPAAMDWDTDGLWSLMLGLTQRTQHITHLPKILYHRYDKRQRVATSEHLSCNLQPEQYPPARFLQTQGLPKVRVVEHLEWGKQLTWDAGNSLVSVIIPTSNNYPWLKRCMGSLREKTVYNPYEVILVDTGSTDPVLLAYFAGLENAQAARRLRVESPFNYSIANNLGAQQAHGELLLFLNDDVEIIEEGWLEEMVRWSQRDEIGAVGAKLLFTDRTIQHAGIVVGMGGHAGHVFRGAREGETGPFGSVEWYRNYLAVTGACMMVPRSVFQEVGGFNEDYQLAFGDVDLCLRLVERGYRVLYTPFARLMHHESVSRGRYIPTGDLIKAYTDLFPLLAEGDPYFNPNLSYRDSIPRLKLRPENRTEFLERILARRNAVEGRV